MAPLKFVVGPFYMLMETDSLFEVVKPSGIFDTRVAARALCDTCTKEHGMVVGYAKQFAKQLLHTLADKKRIDLTVPDGEADPRFSTDYLYGKARGQMFGVLVCRNKKGQIGVLKAFSGQYNGVWNVDGWVPPLVDTEKLASMSSGVERFIKRLGAQIETLPKESPQRKALLDQRKALSQALMKDIHALYRIPNFRGDLRSLPEIVYGEGGIPTGTGDCCAPKLLGYAALHSYTPLGVGEFYFGKENKSGSKRHGAMYTSCKDKCGRILGYMLCGQGTQCPTFPKD